MDPDQNLAQQLTISARLLAAIDRGEIPDPDEVADLCERVQALATWIAAGGFLPAPWARRYAIRLDGLRSLNPREREGG